MTDPLHLDIVSVGSLTPENRERARDAVNVMRTRQPRRRQRYGHAEDQDRCGEDDTVGYLAEAFVHQVTGLPWRHPRETGAEERGLPEVGWFDVRATRYDFGRLLIHESDPDHRPFVLVIVGEINLRIGGWCLGMDAKQPGYWETRWRWPTYAVPQRDLSLTLPAYQDWFV